MFSGNKILSDYVFAASGGAGVCGLNGILWAGREARAGLLQTFGDQRRDFDDGRDLTTLHRASRAVRESITGQ